MHVVRSFFIALSLYSKIPVPQFVWNEEDMQYSLCFFPWVGAVIGLCLAGWYALCERFSIRTICYAAVGCAIPLVISGGFHVDGFMDTMDAFRSYQSRERKLEILKDSHIGAFSVICLALYYLLYLGAFSEVTVQRDLWVLGAGFFLARAFSGLAVVTFRPAKKDGMLCQFASSANRRAVIVALGLQSVLCAAFMFALSPVTGAVVCVAALLTFIYYRWRSYSEFGGITGDTAGYFVTLCELVMAVAAAVCCVVTRGM